MNAQTPKGWGLEFGRCKHEFTLRDVVQKEDGVACETEKIKKAQTAHTYDKEVLEV